MQVEPILANNDVTLLTRRRTINSIYPVTYGSSHDIAQNVVRQNFTLGLQTNDYKFRRRIRKHDLTNNDIFENTIAQVPNTSNKKIIFKYDLQEQAYLKTDFKSKITENKITEQDCNNIFEFLKEKKVENIETEYKTHDNCMWVFTLILLIVFFNVFSQFCICYIINERSNRQRNKLDSRARKIRIQLSEYNEKNKMKDGKGWYWRCGALGAWIELVKYEILQNESDEIFMPFVMEGVKVDELKDKKAKSDRQIENNEYSPRDEENSIGPFPKLPKSSSGNLRRINAPLNYFKKIKNNSDFYNPQRDSQIVEYKNRSKTVGEINDFYDNDKSGDRLVSKSQDNKDFKSSFNNTLSQENDSLSKTPKSSNINNKEKLKVEIIEAELESQVSYEFD